MHANALMPRATINEIVGLRRQSIELFQQGYAMLGQARAMAKRAAPQAYFPSFPDRVKRLLESAAEVNTEEYTAEMTKLVDQAVWDNVLMSMGIEKLMDAQAREKFRQDLTTNPPEVSVENVRATVEALLGDADMIFKRGIATAFSKLDRRFRTHDAFKVGSKIIFSFAFSQYGCWTSRTDEYLRDVERTFHILDGKEQPERYAGIIGAIDEKRRDSGMYMKAFEASSDYFRVKAFKNGNLHVWFLRDDLVEKVNQLLADYYGAALGDASEDARAEAKTASAFRRDLAPAKNFGFFPTPAKLAQDVIESADIRADDRVLEPNAGTGALASLAAAKGAAVTCVEIQPRLISELEQDPRYTVVMAMDFLELSPEQTGEFDKIVMNPPFDRGLDVLHVNHALNFLAPGGTLVAIMSAGAEFKTDAKSTAFRQKIERMRGHFRDLPNGSFAEVGTMVNTVMLTVTKR